MLKKLTLVLLLCSVIAQPVMAKSIDTVALKACSGALQGVKNIDVDAFVRCIEQCKEANSNQFTKAVEWVSDNSMLSAAIALGISSLFFYTLIWPDVGIKVSYTKNSRAELQAGRRP
ncbi:hypothetical protein BH09DEP1_BH09DEP1_3590 [soil metagenome]